MRKFIVVILIWASAVVAFAQELPLTSIKPIEIRQIPIKLITLKQIQNSPCRTIPCPIDRSPERQPLWVLDGEILQSDSLRTLLDELDPKNIEQISVLKGNSALVAYGDKGKNGVIIISTKKIK